MNKPHTASTRASLVLGASGFIGRWVVNELRKRNRRVVGVVRQVSSASGTPDPSMEVIVTDLAREGAAGVIAQVKPGVVYNLAGYGVDRSERDELLAERLNSTLVSEAATVAATMPEDERPRFVHVGSALEYGISGGVLAESTFPRPTTTYGRTKLAGTLALAAVCRATGLRGVTARLFTVFGDGEHTGRLFPSLIATARSGRTLPLSSGQQRRDFAWVGQAAELLVDLGESSFEPGEVVNLASGRMHSVREFALECARQLKVDTALLDFGALPVRPEEMEHDGVSVARLHDLVGRVAERDLARAIAPAIAGSAAASPAD